MSDAGTFIQTLRILFDKGIRYSTLIDVGCADGNFYLRVLTAGLVPGAVPLNLDPNPLYEDSLRKIQETVGGHFRICAITDHEGDVEFTMSTHPYWASLRPAEDSYWERINRLSTDKTTVKATTLDKLSEQLALKPPFLLKLDVQGAEASVLRGASNLLKQTHTVICEADIDDFQMINAMMIENDFVLFDLTTINRIDDGTLGWFYPVYINRALQFARPKAFWNAAHNDAVIRQQIERRNAVLQSNAAILERFRNSSPPSSRSNDSSPATKQIARNAPCPCGSGKKYKHCCGAYC